VGRGLALPDCAGFEGRQPRFGHDSDGACMPGSASAYALLPPHRALLSGRRAERGPCVLNNT
jgi:hypothetical protein